MKKGTDSKAAMISASIDLLNEKGYYGTSTNEILSRSGAPRGSMYYHFPGGKDQIIIEAIQTAGKTIGESLQQIYQHVDDPVLVLAAIFGFFRQQLLDTNFSCGCPISAVALECSGSSSPIAEACKAVYQDWEHAIFDYLQRQFSPQEEEVGKTSQAEQPDLREMATFLFSLIEGALLVARSTASLAPLDIAQKHASFLLQQWIQTYA